MECVRGLDEDQVSRLAGREYETVQEMYDELKKEEGNNPTIGLVLCSDTSNDLARYSILKDSKQLFAAKYLTYLPTEEELSREIREQKEFFELQKGKEAEDED